MSRRPLLPLWIGLMLAVWLARTAGLPIFGEPSLTREDAAALEQGITAQISGTVASRQIRERTVQYTLNKVYLTFGNRTIYLSKLILFAASAASESSSFQDSLKESVSEDKTEYGNNQTDALLRIGSAVRFQGECSFTETPGNPGQFDSRQYYACRKIWVQAFLSRGSPAEVLGEGRGLPERLCAAREYFLEQLRSQLPAESAGVLAAIVLGDRSLLDGELRLDYQAASIYHIISISGMHITLLGMMVFRLLLLLFTETVRILSAFTAGRGQRALPFRRQRLRLTAIAAAGAAAAMGLFCVFAGSPVSALRAWIMFAVLLGAKVTRRTYDSLSALSLAGILLLLENPGYLFYAGFQLSAAAVLAIAVLYPLLTGLLPDRFFLKGSRRRQVEKRLLQAVFIWLSVTAGTLPLTAWHFFEIPLLGLPAGLAAAPLLGFLLAAGFAGLAAGMLHPAAGYVVLFPAGVAIRLLNKAASGIRRLPFSVWTCGRPSLSQVFLYYLLLGFVCILVRRAGQAEHKKKKRGRAVCMGTAAIAAAFGIAALAYRVPPLFSLTMLDVGQGDGLVLTVSSGRPFGREAVFLSDGGSSDVREAGRYRILPYLKSRGISRIDGIFVSHPDDDHKNGVEELLQMAAEGGRPDIGCLLLPAWMADDPDSAELLRLAVRADVPVRYLKEGDRIAVNEGRTAGREQSGDESAEIRVLHPLAEGGAREGNAGSLVLQVCYGTFSALLTGDLEGEGETDILPYLTDVSCLKVAHHGSRFSTDDTFLSAVKPEAALISCGAGNRYGHPHDELLERLEACGTDVLRTDRDGAVMIESDGRRFSVRTFR